MFFALVPAANIEDFIANGLPVGIYLYTKERLNEFIEDLRGRSDPRPRRAIEVHVWFDRRTRMLRPDRPKSSFLPEGWALSAAEAYEGALQLKLPLPAALLSRTSKEYIPRPLPGVLLQWAKARRLKPPRPSLVQLKKKRLAARLREADMHPDPQPRPVGPDPWPPGLYAFVRAGHLRATLTDGRYLELMTREEARAAWAELPTEADLEEDDRDKDILAIVNSSVVYAALKLGKERTYVEVLSSELPKENRSEWVEWVANVEWTPGGKILVEGEVPPALLCPFDPTTGTFPGRPGSRGG